MVGKAKAQLPVLMGKVRELAYAAAKMPEAAAREMVLAVQHDHSRQVDPYGEQHAPTQQGQRFDRQRHVRDGWFPVVDGTSAMLVNNHRAAAALQRPYKGRMERLMHPVDGRGLGTWLKRFERMNRRLVHGALMGAERREATKLAATARRAARQEQRNVARAAAGLPALPARRRSDRARVDALVVRSLREVRRG